MEIISNSLEITGYTVKIWEREAFHIVGYTLIVPPGRKGAGMIPKFWDEVAADGRLAKLTNAEPTRPWLLGLGSWDPECEPHGQRYTICIEQTPHTDLLSLAPDPQFYTTEISDTAWMCFELTEKQFLERFWRDNPYKMMVKLGYAFNTAGFNTGLHFDVYPPEFDRETNPNMQFWITVVKKEQE